MPEATSAVIDSSVTVVGRRKTTVLVFCGVSDDFGRCRVHRLISSQSKSEKQDFVKLKRKSQRSSQGPSKSVTDADSALASVLVCAEIFTVWVGYWKLHSRTTSRSSSSIFTSLL